MWLMSFDNLQMTSNSLWMWIMNKATSYFWEICTWKPSPNCSLDFYFSMQLKANYLMLYCDKVTKIVCKSSLQETWIKDIFSMIFYLIFINPEKVKVGNSCTILQRMCLLCSKIWGENNYFIFIDHSTSR